jgi:hypothetical protein
MAVRKGKEIERRQALITILGLLGAAATFRRPGLAWAHNCEVAPGCPPIGYSGKSNLKKLVDGLIACDEHGVKLRRRFNGNAYGLLKHFGVSGEGAKQIVRWESIDLITEAIKNDMRSHGEQLSSDDENCYKNLWKFDVEEWKYDSRTDICEREDPVRLLYPLPKSGVYGCSPTSADADTTLKIEIHGQGFLKKARVEFRNTGNVAGVIMAGKARLAGNSTWRCGVLVVPILTPNVAPGQEAKFDVMVINKVPGPAGQDVEVEVVSSKAVFSVKG